jgi:hypothetical protein
MLIQLRHYYMSEPVRVILHTPRPFGPFITERELGHTAKKDGKQLDVHLTRR